MREPALEGPEGARILTLYLSLTPERVDGRKYLVNAANELRRIREGIASPEEQVRFDGVARRVEEYVAATEVAGSGIAVFASEPPGLWHVVTLPEAPEDGAAWGPEPAVAPWLGMRDEGRRYAVALLDKERARLFTALMGQIEEQVSFADEVPGKQEQGGWSQARYQRHHEDHVRRHVERTVAAIEELRRRRPFDRLVLGGPDEAMQMLQSELPGGLAASVAGTIRAEMFASDHEVIAAARGAVTTHERARELRAVEELVTDAAKGQRASTGVADTFAALVDGRVHTLYLVDGSREPISSCEGCGRPAEGGACASCGATGRRVVRRSDLAVRWASETGSGVETVRGDAASRLSEVGGIGARLRY